MEPQNLAVTNAIIRLGHSLGLQLVAEGVDGHACVGADFRREALAGLT
jgi:EAL domain-containing protein (putative c-di-GMP-specific phosphodiesterase class I)